MKGIVKWARAEGGAEGETRGPRRTLTNLVWNVSMPVLPRDQGYNTVERDAPRSVGPGWLCHWRRGLKQDIEFMHHGDDVVHGLLQVESLLVCSRAEARKHTLISSMRCTVSLTAHKEEQDVLEGARLEISWEKRLGCLHEMTVISALWLTKIGVQLGQMKATWMEIICLFAGLSMYSSGMENAWILVPLGTGGCKHPEAVTFKAKVNSKDKLSLFRVQIPESTLARGTHCTAGTPIGEVKASHLGPIYRTIPAVQREMPSGEDLPTPAVLVVEYFLLIYRQL
ncbi:hypothetical protein B0H10DRAFT_1953787 [Mycena sp. CBHHK59/15]|nr:hypothetical protein B0H10DRAFT_1953787 [Mycena sp. CBHHK59/15]